MRNIYISCTNAVPFIDYVYFAMGFILDPLFITFFLILINFHLFDRCILD